MLQVVFQLVTHISADVFQPPPPARTRAPHLCCKSRRGQWRHSQLVLETLCHAVCSDPLSFLPNPSSYPPVSRQVNGDGVYSKLKWEAGVHRVQRVPATEAAGRVHTSTATVAIMPEVDEVDVQLDMRDIDVKFARYVAWCAVHVIHCRHSVSPLHNLFMNILSACTAQGSCFS